MTSGFNTDYIMKTSTSFKDVSMKQNFVLSLSTFHMNYLSVSNVLKNHDLVN